MNFKELHQQKAPLIICNVWDVPSTKQAEALHFQAVGTSSAAIASMLGYKDGEQMPFEEMYFVVSRIAKSTEIPLTVDLEAGYSDDPHKILNHIKKLVDIGVVGINIEDSRVTSKRQLVEATSFAKTIAFLKNELVKQTTELFINVRTDTILLGINDAIDETCRRHDIYMEAGADGIFVPMVEQAEDIMVLKAYFKLPLNVMTTPKLPDIAELSKMGVNRISMGNFLHHKLYNYCGKLLTEIKDQNSISPLF